MATKTIPKTSDRKPQKRTTWAQKSRERIAEAFDSSVLKLIEHGTTSPYLSSFIEDEEMTEHRDRFLALLEGIEDRAKNLPKEEYEEICRRTIKAEEMYYSRGCLGADKMAELLIRFYLQTHWNLSSPRRFMASANPFQSVDCCR